ncbi:hypothetical protein MUCCIDRAFT_109357 [Mucor lusitanicus CBS 277.49]|uniref:F-box domain-containing protein n=1 Tax=Mucor lusitanicus CBS 277.49 TaxID=747725 RepID=A0A168MXB4_MUCCL|nr:hypothetical protein MUCCIDRAFT_109357 [Mucor lusitanicus CBS 277.49]
MEKLPAEVYRIIGSHLNQQEQRSCALVCKHWKKVFSPLVFAKAVLTTRSQVECFLSQGEDLKKYTISLHLVAPITNEEFRHFVSSCPKVKDLTLFSNYSNKLEVKPAIQLISKHWSLSLVKIRMDSLLMPRALAFLAPQLQDITGDLEDLLIPGSSKLMYSLPNLTTLEIENGTQSSNDAIRFLNQLHSSCPKLKNLTICSMRFPVFPDLYADVQPFSLNSFHLKNCDGIIEENAAQLLRIFPGLTDLSLLRTESIIRPDLVDVVHSLHDAYPAISTYSPQIRNLSIDYVYGNIDTSNYFSNLFTPLSNLHTLHLELSCQVKGVTLREKVSLSNILTGAPQLKKLSMYGLAHLVTVDGLDHYCVGKIGHYDSRTRRIVQRDAFFEDEDENPPSPPADFDIEADIAARERSPDPYFEAYSVLGVDYLLFYTDDGQEKYGEGEVLIEESSELMISKKMGAIDSADKTYKYWNVSRQPRSLQNYTTAMPCFLSGLTILQLEMVTLRNPTFRWINSCCPNLVELSVLKTGPYPWCDIYLKDLQKLQRFNMSYELYYPHLPVLILIGEESTNIYRPATIHGKSYIEDSQYQHVELQNLYQQYQRA